MDAHLGTILTPREAAVLALIVKGSTNKAAAKVLAVSPRTVEFHRANIMLKMDAKNLAELMRIVFDKDTPRTRVARRIG